MKPNDLHTPEPRMAGQLPLDAETPGPGEHDLIEAIETACARIAPVWPLDRFVAVNPFHGLRALDFDHAGDLLRRIAGVRMYMPRGYFRERLARGEIGERDLVEAAARCASTLPPEQLRAALDRERAPRTGVPLITALVDELDADDWSEFVIDRISHHCAAYFDMGQATWQHPWSGMRLYDAWRAFAALDYSADMMGQGGIRARVRALPEAPRACIGAALGRLGIPQAAWADYLHAALLDVGGWAAWTRLLRWEAELEGGSDDHIEALLAIRLAWEVLVYEHKASPGLTARWHALCAELERRAGDPDAPDPEDAIDRVLLCAQELAYQRGLIARLRAHRHSAPATRPPLQAAFCIDVRSEVIRRALETVCPRVQTLGFAGFFGAPIAHQPFGADHPRPQLPVLLAPRYRVCSELHEAEPEEQAEALAAQHRRLGIGKAWKTFKMGAASCFSFVEAAGFWLYVPKLIGDSLGWSRPVPAPDDPRLDPEQAARLAPSLAPCGHPHADHALGIPEAERVALAEGILRGMSLTAGFARLVLLVGHGSSSVNNPHATGLDCGACGGQSGETNARVVAALLNAAEVRAGLAARGIAIPQDTWFLPALHDTTTDRIRLFDHQHLPADSAEELAELGSRLDQAGELTRLQRATLLGLGGREGRALTRRVEHRARDWSQVRPEWGLAGNACFIAAPRTRTQGLDLGGRAFLHDYDWRADHGFATLELIMTAPMVVASWINLQYYASCVDNRRFGSGNKVLHNVVGGAIGVIEGNGGDLRVGLPLQSLHDGRRWIHEPIRLSVFIEAPQSEIDAVIARHDLVRELVEHGWLHLFRIESSGDCARRTEDGDWCTVESH
ncbi:YbcC family protein [Marichromatium gracile]|uniref:Probable inorganic carbon transporter subunit DabA n=1 Tax=Marichromatium gracile TaxID=1048 RepID=A0A4R4A6U2_MARGR|nr:DUF2309 domain-containing protein [Marichromatium gracile]MBK1708458.1 DUF2309 domain-containing protein [Marichromatium gracile]TCW34166.1 hypothetical protein EDC29_11218 [Marichromatium gracile]